MDFDLERLDALENRGDVVPDSEKLKIIFAEDWHLVAELLRQFIDSGVWSQGLSGVIYYNGGNVGIGTTSPGAKLEVSAGSSVVPAKFLSPDATSDAVEVLVRIGQAESAGKSFGIGFRQDTTAGDEGAYIAIYGDAVGSGFFQKKGGNVGIGTTAPKSKFAVVGLPTSASGLTAGDFFTQTATQLGGSGTTKVVCVV